MLWEDMREEDFKSAAEECGKVCVMPAGCMEMHGQHIPVGTDCYQAEYTAREAAKIEPVCVFPTFKFGDVQGLQHYGGAVILSVELEQMLLTELCENIARNGFKKIMILNGHGGNTFLLGNFVRSTQHDKKDYVVMKRNDYRYGIRSLAAELEAGKEFPELTPTDVDHVITFVRNNYLTGHACIEETSIMLAIAPETVHMDRVNVISGMPTGTTKYLAEAGLTDTTRFWINEYPNSYSGEKVEWASEGIGRALLRRRVDDQVEACRRLKQDDRILDWNAEWNEKW